MRRTMRTASLHACCVLLLFLSSSSDILVHAAASSSAGSSSPFATAQHKFPTPVQLIRPLWQRLFHRQQHNNNSVRPVAEFQEPKQHIATIPTATTTSIASEQPITVTTSPPLKGPIPANKEGETQQQQLQEVQQVAAVSSSSEAPSAVAVSQVVQQGQRSKSQTANDLTAVDWTTLSPFSLASLGSTLRWTLQNHGDKLRKWGWTGCRLGLTLYLIQEMFKALTEVLSEEFWNDLSGETQENSRYARPEEVAKLVNPDPKKRQSPPPQHLMDLSMKLVAAGLPLTTPQDEPDNEDATTTQTTTTPNKNSVETVLSTLTKTEAALLQQTLWTPPFATITAENKREVILNSWTNIAGLHHVKEALLDLALSLTTTSVNHNNGNNNNNTDTAQQPSNIVLDKYSKLLQHPPGVLLYGPPGCGKTMLVKALATTARARFLIVTPSTLLRKYVGDTNLQVRALFSLAKKLSPCILLIDELDGLFLERNVHEHEVSRDLKTEFLQLWDGISSFDGHDDSSSNGILVVGATNRPFEVDPAVLRRMPQSYYVGLPNDEARRDMLMQLLQGVPLDADLSVTELAMATPGYSPSDLQQVLRTAVTIGPLREARLSMESEKPLRPLKRHDIMMALRQVAPTPLTTNYRNALAEFARGASGGGGEGTLLQAHHHQHGPAFYDMGTVNAHVFFPPSSLENERDELSEPDSWTTTSEDDEDDDEDDDTPWDDDDL